LKLFLKGTYIKDMTVLLNNILIFKHRGQRQDRGKKTVVQGQQGKRPYPKKGFGDVAQVVESIY
jgi:hypothetical protein